MDIELFGRINGYLNGISDINSWSGCCYSWIFDFREYKYTYDIKECIQMFIEDSYFGHRDDIKILGLGEVVDEYNFVSNRLIKDLKEFFDNIEVKVFKLIIEPTYIDEFGWEQYFFDCGKVAYDLSFYQQG